ncbi:MAG: hypothetical protein BMS9Abin36_0819 [Gammaproteobacteria bacterium]|nr:MAG: hypothetical protein BMS9Abin36_0819 [Gammaproteobacteria bacterium]
MNKDIDIADIVVHLHPESSCDDRDKVERDLRSLNGVISVHFNAEEHPHAMVVAYNPAAVNSQEILAETRKCDSEAVMAGI